MSRAVTDAVATALDVYARALRAEHKAAERVDVLYAREPNDTNAKLAAAAETKLEAARETLRDALEALDAVLLGEAS